MQQHRRLPARIQALFLCLGGISALAAVPLAAQSHHFVYLASATGHTISGFELSPASGTLTPIAGPPFNNGRDPGAMTLHPSGRFLYVMNAGAKNVSVFAVNPVTGVLNEVPASPFAVGGGNTPELLLVEPSGKFLYVVSTSDTADGKVTWVSYYAVEQATGALSATPEPTLLSFLFTPAGLVSTAGDNFLYLAGTASPASGSIVSFRTIELDQATREISNVDVLPGTGESAHSVAISPNGQFLFVGRGQSAGSIDTYTISADGSPQYSNNSLDPSALPYALAVDASGSYLYAAVDGVGILGFSINAGSGELMSLGPAFSEPVVSPSTMLVADPVEQFLYYEQRAFAILDQGALEELSVSPLPVAGSVTGIAAANPPLDDVQAISAPVVALTPSSLVFSDQYVGAASQPQQVSLSNTGDDSLILSNILLTGTNATEFGLSTGDCLAVLQPSNGCTMTIIFQPTAEGVRQAALTVVDNAIGNPHTVALTGAALFPFTLHLDSFIGSVVAGQMAQYNLRLVPAPGFAGQVVLACSGAPAGAVCNAPPSLQLNGATPTLFQVSVPTMARSVVLPLARRSHPSVGRGSSRRILAWGAVLATLFLLLSRLRLATGGVLGPRCKSQCAFVILLVWVSLGVVSCGGAGTGTTSTSPPSAIGTPAGQYALTLTAASGSVAQTVPLSLAVQ